jgi:3-oxoacyl-[acyl-carrier-protein] synthase-3
VQRINGAGGAHLHMKAGGSRKPSTFETVQNKEHYVYQEGKQVFKFAVTEMANVSVQILERNGLEGKDVAFFVPHQANLRIIEASANRMGIDMDKVVINIDRYANTTAATIPLCLYEICEENKRIRKGDNVVMSAFGAGFTWGSILLRWWE